MKDTFEEVYNAIDKTLACLPYWSIDSIVDNTPTETKGYSTGVDCIFKTYHIYYSSKKHTDGYIYLPYNNKYIKVFFYE